MDLSTPRVMAIINATPDSFYTSCTSDQDIVHCAVQAAADGADIIDIGGCSTRPGADEVSAEEELRRCIHAAELIRRELPDMPLSVDTFRADVARRMVEDYGVSIINDISGGTMDEQMFQTVADTGAAYILMHMRGTPQTMQQCTDYDDLMADIIDFMQQRVYQLKQLGVHDIIIDPGFGFAKTLEQNYELLSKMHYLHELHLPLLAGLSHKSMLYRLLQTTPDQTLNATTVVNTIALMKGAHILRVHEVRPAVEAVSIISKLNLSSC